VRNIRFVGMTRIFYISADTRSIWLFGFFSQKLKCRLYTIISWFLLFIDELLELGKLMPAFGFVISLLAGSLDYSPIAG
jgi:hypothetical protein